MPTVHELARVCSRAETAGAGALWACDHLFWHGPNIECLSAVTVAALNTERAKVGSCVLQLPLRRAPAVAKQVASLQQLSDGRLVLGVGVGAHRGEYEAAGADFDTRGTHMDDAIATMRAAWAGEGSPAYLQLPAPGKVPVWIGGSSEPALRRSARLGDGWIPLFLPPADYATALERLDKEMERRRRDPDDVSRAIVVFVAMGGAEERDNGLEWMASLYDIDKGAFERHLVCGDARRAARSLARYYEAGAEHVAVFVACDDPAAAFEDLAGEVGEMELSGP